MRIVGANFLYRPFTNKEILGNDLIGTSAIQDIHNNVLRADLFDTGRFGEVLEVGQEVKPGLMEKGDVVMLHYGLIDMTSQVSEETQLAAISPKTIVYRGEKEEVVKTICDLNDGIIIPVLKVRVVYTKAEFEAKLEEIKSGVNYRKESYIFAVNDFMRQQEKAAARNARGELVVSAPINEIERILYGG